MHGGRRGAALVLLATVLCSCSTRDQGGSDRAEPTPETRGGASLLARIRSEGTLVAAVPYDGRPPRGETNPSLTIYTGFAVEFAEAVAQSLDVRLRFAPSSADATAHLSKDGSIHLSFPLVPLTRQLARTATVTRPYVASSGRVLVPPNWAGRAPRDLTGGRVCAPRRPWRTPGLGALRARVVVRDSPFECLELLERREVDAIAGPDLVLARLAYELCRRCTVTGKPRGTTYLSAVVPPGERALRRRVNAVFEAALQDGRWTRWYAKWIGRYSTGPPPSPPAGGVRNALRRV